jgi:YidC/Oxa1 family membrane protein insertase
MEKRLILFLVLSFAIFYGSAYIFEKIYPKPATPNHTAETGLTSPSPNPSPSLSVSTPAPTTAAANPTATSSQASQEPLREITVKTDLWVAKLSNKGGVVTQWTMTAFPNGKPIDAPTGVELFTEQLSREIGATFRFLIPGDQALQDQLNFGLYKIENLPENSLTIGKGEKREISFVYTGDQGIESRKTITFKGNGYDGSTGYEFDLQASVTRNGAPVDVDVVIGPNFGDQKVTHIDVYKHAPQLTYAVAGGGGVYRHPADTLKGTYVSPTEGLVNWAAVDDNYFALAIFPPVASNAYRILNNEKFVSIGVAANNGQINRVYAGPKDLDLLVQLSKRYGLEKSGNKFEDIVSYSWLNFIRGLIHPIAQYMLKGLRLINGVTNNFGWSIVILTVLLNMLFFPLRWKSSVAMKRAAAMQPKMKDIQERMKSLPKDDPRMVELQKEQLSLMKEGNPLMGCLPLLLQMPFFMAVYAILTVSIEARHAPFFGWLKDLSVADPFYILPILMCVTMIAQTALTPSTMDPVQKKVQYLMPVILSVAFFRTAPAGLVLYWMVSNLVGVVQQFIINKLNPPAATTASTNDKTGPKPPNGSGGNKKGKKAKEALAS